MYNVAGLAGQSRNQLRGKSELLRAGCWVMPSGIGSKTDSSASATENIPPGFILVRVKWRGKSSPAVW